MKKDFSIYIYMTRLLSFIILSLISICVYAKTVIVAGTGLTGLWTAYSIAKEADLLHQNIEIIIVGKWDWVKESASTANNNTLVFSHEASSFGPIGIQPHSGLLWNTDNEVVELVKSGIGKPEASFYTAENLTPAGWEFLELYTGWHARHPDGPASSVERQRSLLAFNMYAKQLWLEFQASNRSTHLFDLHLDGAWRIYDDPVHFKNALNSLETLKKLGYPAEIETDKNNLAAKIPFYRDTMLQGNKQAIFFQHDGLISSNKLRLYLTNYLRERKSVKFCLDSQISKLTIDSNGNVTGVELENHERITADITILATGLNTKYILAKHDIELPLWNVWGAAAKAPLLEQSSNIPTGGVSFHKQRCITAIPDGKTVIVAGTSMVLPEDKFPTKDLYEPKLRKAMHEIFGNRVDYDQIIFNVAPRTGIADDLPIVGFDIPSLKNLIVLIPTSHLGNTQSIALGKLTAHEIMRRSGYLESYEQSLNLEDYKFDRFKHDIQMVRREKTKHFH